MSRPTTLHSNSVRWAGRTPSQQERRERWVPPTLDPTRANSIMRYSSTNHFLGDTSPDGLRQSANLLTVGPSPSPSTSVVEVQANNEIPRPTDGSETPRAAMSPVEIDSTTYVEMATEYNLTAAERMSEASGNNTEQNGQQPATEGPSTQPPLPTFDGFGNRQEILTVALKNYRSLSDDMSAGGLAKASAEAKSQQSEVM